MHGKHIIEVLTPKQSSEHFERELDVFAERYQRVLDEVYVASVLDNPLGIPRFQVTEVIGDLGLAAVKDQVLLHMNTFHTKADVDAILNRARDLDLTNLLVVTGDARGDLRLGRARRGRGRGDGRRGRTAPHRCASRSAPERPPPPQLFGVRVEARELAPYPRAGAAARRDEYRLRLALLPTAGG